MQVEHVAPSSANLAPGYQARRQPESGWLTVRKPLSARRAAVLTALSFLLPLGLWSAVSYLPFLWHPDIKLHISADREGMNTVFTEGDHLSPKYFREFEQVVREDNRLLLEARGNNFEPDRSTRRANQKLFRHLAPLLIANNLLDRSQKEDDAALARLWDQIADGRVVPTKPRLSSENLSIVQQNMADARAANTAVGETPQIALRKLIPQGVPANPVYLPAPHEVIHTGWYDFTKPPEGDKPWMIERLAHSMQVVFLGFLLSCLVGIPLGILCGTFDFFSKLFEPFIDFFRYLPAPAFSTLLVAIFLAHDAPKIALIFLGTFFQLVLVVAKTTRQLNPCLLEAAQTLGAKPHQLVTNVVVPGILPDLYNDLRILLGWSWTWLVIAELIGVKSGLTEFIETQGRWRNFDSVWPVIILIGIIGFATDQILSKARGFLFPHTRSESGAGA